MCSFFGEGRNLGVGVDCEVDDWYYVVVSDIELHKSPKWGQKQLVELIPVLQKIGSVGSWYTSTADSSETEESESHRSELATLLSGSSRQATPGRLTKNPRSWLLGRWRSPFFRRLPANRPFSRTEKSWKWP